MPIGRGWILFYDEHVLLWSKFNSEIANREPRISREEFLKRYENYNKFPFAIYGISQVFSENRE